MCNTCRNEKKKESDTVRGLLKKRRKSKNWKMSESSDVSKIRSILNVMNVEYEGQVENQLLKFTHRTFRFVVSNIP